MLSANSSHWITTRFNHHHCQLPIPPINQPTKSNSIIPFTHLLTSPHILPYLGLPHLVSESLILDWIWGGTIAGSYRFHFNSYSNHLVYRWQWQTPLTEFMFMFFYVSITNVSNISLLTSVNLKPASQYCWKYIYGTYWANRIGDIYGPIYVWQYRAGSKLSPNYFFLNPFLISTDHLIHPSSLIDSFISLNSISLSYKLINSSI